MGGLVTHRGESLNEAAARIAGTYSIPSSLAPELTTALNDAACQKASLRERLASVERLVSQKVKIEAFFKTMRSAASILNELDNSEGDLARLVDALHRAFIFTGPIRSENSEYSSDGEILDFLRSIQTFSAYSDELEEFVLEHDRRNFREVKLWDYCLDPIFSFWISTFGRSIANSFEKDDGPHREQGEPLSEGARFLAECMLAIDPSAYRHETLMRLLDTYRKGDRGMDAA